MMQRWWLWAVGAVLVTSPVRAQGGTPAESRPDTLGANVAVEIGKGAPTDYDFLVGEWTFVFQSRRPDGGFSAPVPGTWTVRKTLDGRMVEDTWHLSSNPEPTRTWRVFNPAREVWEIQGLNIRRGSWDPGVTWSSGDERYVQQTFTGLSLARIRYYRIQADRFSWRADVSTDGGQTWVRDRWILEAQRVK